VLNSEPERLALDGGLPELPAGPPAWPRPNPEVRAALEAAYADGSWGQYHGPHCERLREALARMHGVSQAWLCCSGTIAIELALRGLRIGPGDEVLVAAYDFAGNFRAIEAVGARPVLVDLQADTWTIDPDQVAAAASSLTRAIIVSHLHGSLAEMPRLREIAAGYGLAIVEDACQVPGSVIGGKPVGAWGDCGVLSFGGSKLLTAGRGGAIVTARADVIQRIKIFCERGNDAFPLSELQAAVLLPQLAQLPAANEQRWQAVRQLLAACGQIAGMNALKLPVESGSATAFYKLPWLLAGASGAGDSPAIAQRRERFIAALRAEGIAMDAGFRGFARRTSQRCRIVGDLQQACRAAAGTVILHHPVLLEPPEVIAGVARGIRKVAERLLA
jgi:perosamine synthetase